MKIGDLVMLEYKGVDLEEKRGLKIGIVIQGLPQMSNVLWGNGEQRWCLNEHLQMVKKCP